MSVLRSIVNLLSGVRLTIALCILLAVVSIVGTLVPQNLDPVQYQRLYGEAGSGLVTTLGISNIYHSPGFIFLLCLLAANLIACSWKRFPSVWRSVRRDTAVPADPSFATWSHRDVLTVSMPGESAERAVESVLGRCRKRTEVEPGLRILLFEKNRISRFGPYLSHVSLLLILLGGLIGVWFGFRGSMALVPGEEKNYVSLEQDKQKIPLGFTLRCDRFVIEKYPDREMVKEFRSEVSVLDDQGEMLRQADIRVNHPLKFRGIAFYQASHGKIPIVRLTIKNRESGEVSRAEAPFQQPFELPGDGRERGVLVSFRENMNVPMEMVRRTGLPRSDRPMVKISVFDSTSGEFGPILWVYDEFPGQQFTERGESRGPGPGFVEDKNGKYLFEMEGVEAIPFTVLEVARDPGTPLVWSGCVLLVLGFVLSFLLDHEIFWVSLRSGESGNLQVHLAGRAVRHPRVYSTRFERRRINIRNKMKNRT